MVKLTSINDLEAWILDTQLQNPKYTYWTLYSGTEVVAAKRILENSLVTASNESNLLLLNNIRRYGRFGGDFLIMLKADPKDNSGGMKSNLFLMPESERQSNPNIGIQGIPSVQSLNETINDKVAIAELKAKIQSLQNVPQMADHFIGRIMGLADKAPETALNIAGGLLHRAIGLLEKLATGEIIPPMQMQPMQMQPMQPMQQGEAGIAGLPEQKHTEVVESQIENSQVNKPQNKATVIMKSKEESLSILQKIFELDEDVLLDALSEYLIKNQGFAKPLILGQIKPFIKS